jgi:hypothetical protein
MDIVERLKFGPTEIRDLEAGRRTFVSWGCSGTVPKKRGKGEKPCPWTERPSTPLCIAVLKWQTHRRDNHPDEKGLLLARVWRANTTREERLKAQQELRESRRQNRAQFPGYPPPATASRHRIRSAPTGQDGLPLSRSTGPFEFRHLPKRRG